MDEYEYQHLQQVKRQVEQTLLALPGVHGVSIGRKQVHGQPTEQLAIVVHLSKKRPPQEVPPAEVIPSQIQGIPTDVLEHAPFTASGSPLVTVSFEGRKGDMTNYRPLRPGSMISTANADVSALFAAYNTPGATPEEFEREFQQKAARGDEWVAVGTLGAFLTDPKNPQARFGLTNQHVVARGFEKRVYQALPWPGNEIGSVVMAILNDALDAALVQLEGVHNPACENEVLEIGSIEHPTSTVTHLDVLKGGLPVQKRGAITRRTTGKVTHVDVTVLRQEDGSSMTQQFLITPDTPPFCSRGDSGAVVLSLNNPARTVVGLLWGAADDASGVGIATPIETVLNALGCVLVR